MPPQDPRLNSVHLEPDRREQYRKIRNKMLQSRGSNTVCADEEEPLSLFEVSKTIIHKEEKQTPTDVVCWLMDDDYMYPLKVGLNTVGRAKENDVVVRDGYVSRRHCSILVHSDYRCEIFDMASKNGTFVNGMQIDRAMFLNVDDQIQMCNCVLTFKSKKCNNAVDSIEPAQTLTGG